MQNVVLTVHLILALLLIGVVLLQRSEGGGLGLGGGGGGGGVMTGRQAANALTRATWLLAGAFLVTSIALTVIAARNSAGASIMDRISPAPGGQADAPAGVPSLPDYAPPPGVGQPILPPGATGPAIPGTALPASDTSAPLPVLPGTAITPPAPAPATEVEAPAAANGAVRVPMGETAPDAPEGARTIRVPLTEPASTN
ncbi:preprotein translocase subunit SecG [Paracoccus sp. Z118]|uniref:preprotein translocase subunit SecG n=1 Tax=Paracoccus sp. Z118 TaxID=2851017 RepID=UPI001C2C4093|nr:preprotein translocase subunit SecG [Paracoccus sp. Z118]